MLFRNTYYVILSDIFLRLSKLAAIVLFTRNFPIEEYGLYATALSAITMTAIFYDIGLTTKMTKILVHDWSDYTRKEYVLLKFQLIWIMILISSSVFFLIEEKIQHFQMFFVVILSVAVGEVISIISATYKAKSEFNNDYKLKMSISLTYVSFAIIGFILFDSIAAIVAMQLIGMSLMLIRYFNFISIHDLKDCFVFSFKKLKILLGASPLAIYGLFTSIIVSIDTVFVSEIVSYREGGIYNIATRLLYLIQLPATAFSIVLFSKYSYKNKKNKNQVDSDYKNTIKAFFLIILVSIFMIILTILLGEYFVVLIFGTKYISSYEILYLLLPSLIPLYAGNIVINFIIHNSMYIQLAIITGVSALVSVLLNYYLVPISGSHGAAIATNIAQYTIFLLTIMLVIYKVKKTNLDEDLCQ